LSWNSRQNPLAESSTPLCSVARFLDAARIVVACFVTSAWMLAATRAGAQTADTSPSGIVSAPTSGTTAPGTPPVPTPVPNATTAPTRTPGFRGRVTPGYGTPGPSTDWTFRWTGFFTASLQTSENQRVDRARGQRTVLHVPPQTIDEYALLRGGRGLLSARRASSSLIHGSGERRVQTSWESYAPVPDAGLTAL
jgi:hypothetical protein